MSITFLITQLQTPTSNYNYVIVIASIIIDPSPGNRYIKG